MIDPQTGYETHEDPCYCTDDTRCDACQAELVTPLETLRERSGFVMDEKRWMEFRAFLEILNIRELERANEETDAAWDRAIERRAA